MSVTQSSADPHAVCAAFVLLTAKIADVPQTGDDVRRSESDEALIDGLLVIGEYLANYSFTPLVDALRGAPWAASESQLYRDQPTL